MRYVLIVLWMLFWSTASAIAQVSIGIGFPGVSIGINVPVYPDLVQVPGYPVYYAPRLDSNFFFYDGLYWVYQDDSWYASSWYNGPWGLVAPEVVPLFVLRVPVRYYRAPPGYFRGWRPDAPPRWGDHWGNEWQQRRHGWDQWNRNAVPAPAPLPVYQRQYGGDRYPRVEQQRTLQTQNYRYQPRDAVVRQHYQEQILQKSPAPTQPVQRAAPPERHTAPQDNQRIGPSPQKGGNDFQRSVPMQTSPQQRTPAVEEQRQRPPQGADQREQQPRANQQNVPQGKGASQEQRRGPEQDKGRDKGEGREKGEERGQDRNK